MQCLAGLSTAQDRVKALEKHSQTLQTHFQNAMLFFKRDVVFFVFLCFFKKSVKTAVPDARKPPGALVSTKLVERYRFGTGHNFLFFVSFL